jgi:hypothetical protein
MDVWRKANFAGLSRTAWLCAPYLVWVALGQNLRDQPRHVLPLVIVATMGLARAASLDVRARWACLGLLTLVSVRTSLDAWARYRDPPAGAAIASYVASLPGADRALVFGVSSVRFFEPTNLAHVARGAETMGDVATGVARAATVPSRVFVTSEVTVEHPLPAERKVATFCRPPRLDRRRACLDLFEVDPALLRAY